MTDTLESLQSRFVELREFAQRVSEAMTSAAMELRDFGLEVAPGLLADMEQYRAEFYAVRDQVSVWRSTASRAASLDELERELSQHALSAQALQVVAQAESLRHRDCVEFAPLQRVLSECANLRDGAASATGDIAAALARGEHPLAALVTLIVDGDHLSDDRWEQLQDFVVTSYGRELATAVARGRLTIDRSSSAA